MKNYFYCSVIIHSGDKKKFGLLQTPGFDPSIHNNNRGNAYLIKRLDHRVTIVVCDTYTVRNEQSWPSGLRRCVQVAVSSDAWVRIPQNAIY